MPSSTIRCEICDEPCVAGAETIRESQYFWTRNYGLLIISHVGFPKSSQARGLTSRDQISYPLFAAALRLFADQQPDPADVVDQMRGAGLQEELAYESFPLVFPTGRYLQLVRNRYMSLLSHFDDAQLDAGVAEIRRAHQGEQIAFTDTFAFVLGTAA